MDWLDVHAYWQHPRFPGRPWDGNNWNVAHRALKEALYVWNRKTIFRPNISVDEAILYDRNTLTQIAQRLM